MVVNLSTSTNDNDDDGIGNFARRSRIWIFEIFEREIQDGGWSVEQRVA
jgi:hypothetical protein